MAIMTAVVVVNCNRKGNLANSWEEKALKVRLEMLSMADGELKTNLQIQWDRESTGAGTKIEEQ